MLRTGGLHMTREATVFVKTFAVRISTVLFAIFMGLTVVGLPVSIWLVTVALRRVELDAVGLRIKPGGEMRWAEVARFGIGFKTGQLEDSSQRITTVHLMLQDINGRCMTVHINNYERSGVLLEEIKRRSACVPEPLKVSFFFQRLSFQSTES